MTLRMINAIQINEILQAWIELLCLLVPKLSLKVVKEDLLQLALARGKVEEAVSSRVVCSRLLGAIAPMLEPQEIEQLFLNKAMALCQDTDAEVRISMCNQINAISHAVGIETTKVFLSFYLELHSKRCWFKSICRATYSDGHI
ncbi:hypothetical protein L7F22_011774 [Adiantum nelumboides]|nr:hypothetical protein [Adiantum nelumboides]